ncbi:MAG: hypothetical protein GF368_00730 [Candidatus Aenigmarchaeota archaeon]|nr:hypothetical protein [Candidatus Aenigmarchaeota archaeon]
MIDKSLLAKEITTKPDTIQFAKDRKYEESWIIKRNGTKPNKTEIDDYLNDDFKTLIVEFLWNSHDCSKMFVLTIFLDETCPEKDFYQFVVKCLDIFYKYEDFLTLVNRYESEVIGYPFLFMKPIEKVTMSVFNHWLSVGPVTLWEKGEKLNTEKVKERIQSRPDIERTELNFQGMVFMINFSGKYEGPYHGIKTPCCRKEGGTWIVDHEKVAYWMKELLNE